MSKFERSAHDRMKECERGGNLLVGCAALVVIAVAVALFIFACRLTA